MQIDKLSITELKSVFLTDTNIDIMKDARDFLVDASINSREILKTRSSEHIYTTVGIDVESYSKWGSVLDSDNIFRSSSIDEIRSNSEMMTLTASFADSEELVSTVYFNSLNNAVICDKCGAPARGVLVNSSGTGVYVCQHLSISDQRLLVLATAFPGRFVLITDDGCLGWSSAPLYSYSLEKDKYWRHYF